MSTFAPKRTHPSVHTTAIEVVAAAAEGCDALVAGGMMLAGVWR